MADSLVRNALSGNRGGDGNSGGGGGSDFISSLRYGGLFNENNGHNANKPKVTVSGAGPGGKLLVIIDVLLGILTKIFCSLFFLQVIQHKHHINHNQTQTHMQIKINSLKIRTETTETQSTNEAQPCMQYRAKLNTSKNLHSQRATSIDS